MSRLISYILSFQSSPDPKAGRNNASSDPVPVLERLFQSSPDPKAGRNHHDGGDSPESKPVPILARPEGRAQRGASLSYAVPSNVFQSSPDPKAGRNRGVGAIDHGGIQVPILARPEGRAQPHHCNLAYTAGSGG